MLDNAIAHTTGYEIDNRGMDFGSGRERPPFFPSAIDYLRDLIGQLSIDPSLGFVSELAFGNRGLALVRPGSFGDRKSPGLIRNLV